LGDLPAKGGKRSKRQRVERERKKRGLTFCEVGGFLGVVGFFRRRQGEKKRVKGSEKKKTLGGQVNGGESAGCLL